MGLSGHKLEPFDEGGPGGACWRLCAASSHLGRVGLEEKVLFFLNSCKYIFYIVYSTHFGVSGENADKKKCVLLPDDVTCNSSYLLIKGSEERL